MRRWSSPPQQSPLEWAVAGLGLLLLLGSIGYSLALALDGRSLPPLIAVDQGEVFDFQGGYHLGFVARNVGSETGAAVRIEGRLLRGGEVAEASSVTLSYVPGGSSRPGGLFFSQDPREFQVELRATGYESP